MDTLQRQQEISKQNPLNEIFYATIQIYITKMETVDKSYGLITYLKR